MMNFPIRRLLHSPAAWRPSWRACALAAVLAALGACGGGGDGGSTGATGAALSPAVAPPAASPVVLDASSSCGLVNFKATLLQQINDARASARSCGAAVMPAVPALAWNDLLFSAAARHSRDMAQNDYFAHDSQDGRTPGQRIEAEGYLWRAFGENIAAGQLTVTEVMGDWLASPGHCSNLMSANVVNVGVSCVQQAGSTFGTYWTMDLGSL